MPKTYRHPLRVYIQINPYFCNILLIIIMKDKTLKNILDILYYLGGACGEISNN